MDPNENPTRRRSGRNLGLIATGLSALTLASGSINVNVAEGNANKKSSAGPSLPPTIEPGVSPWQSVSPTLEAIATPSLSPAISPVESVNPTPESLRERLQNLNVTSEMQEAASREFDRLYQMVKSERFMNAGKGALRVQFGQNRNSDFATLEDQAFGEFLAVSAGDFETAERLMKFDDRYKYRNTNDSDIPDGLAPWKVHLSDIGKESDVWEYNKRKRKPDGEVNWADLEDHTVVSNVMMYMALARLLHNDPARQAEGREILDIMADVGMIESGTRNRRFNLVQAFQWEDSDNLLNPAYPNMRIIEMAAELNPAWSPVIQDTMAFFRRMNAKIENGGYVAPPTWLDVNGNLTNNEGEEAKITYDVIYYVMNQLDSAINSNDPAIRENAIENLRVVKRFFKDKIAIRDGNDNITDFDSNRLKDGYNVNGTVNNAQRRYSGTAFVTAAFISSLVSEEEYESEEDKRLDEQFRTHMYEAYMRLDRPSAEPLNDFFNAAAAGLIGGRMGKVDGSEVITPQSTPEPTPSPVIVVATESPVVSSGEIVLRPGEVVMNGDPDKAIIYITIDDGWQPDQIERMLDIAKTNGIKLTFFPVGDVVNANPELYRRAYLEGHSIQNHSMTHAAKFDDPEKFLEITEDEIREEILGQLQAVRNAIGNQEYIQHSFRPPFGRGAPPWDELDSRYEKVARELGYAITTWTEFSEGWREGVSEEEVIDQLDDHITNGSILGLNAIPTDADALDNLIAIATEKGLIVESLDRLFEDPSGTIPEATISPEPSPGISGTPVQEIEEFEGIVGPGDVVFEGQGGRPEIFFTIDDGWTPKEMIEILDVAKKYGIKLTLFPVGQQIQANPEIYKRAYREGHSIQNHTWSHFDGFKRLSDMTDKEIEDEITKQRELVKNVLGVEQQYFVRIPYGWGMPVFGEQLSARIERIARKQDLAIAAWSAISPGWKNGRQNTEEALRGEVRKGAIIVLHDEPEDIDALEAFIKQVLDKGIKPVTMDRLFRKN